MSELKRLIFSCEFLSPQTLLDKKAPELLAETDCYLALKVDFKDITSPSYEVLVKRFIELKIADHLLPWPMLPVEDGYYANELTADKFSDLVQSVLEWYKTHNFPYPLGIIIDLEPSTDPEAVKKAEEVRRLGLTKTAKDLEKLPVSEKEPAKKQGLDIMSTAGKIIDMIDENVNPDRFAKGASRFAKMQEMMHTYGDIKAIAVALPLAYEDIFDGKLMIQDFMTVPITHPNCRWDMINFMVFNTDYVAATKGIVSNEDYRHLIYSYAKEFIEKWGAEKSSITLGITNVGIQDVRAVQLDPELYRLEVSAILAAGMEEAGIYALDGVLEQSNPKEWIQTVKKAKATDFVVEPNRMEFIGHARKVLQILDQLTPTIKYLVESGKIMEILQAILKK
jgi:hypothetical protein